LISHSLTRLLHRIKTEATMKENLLQDKIESLVGSISLISVYLIDSLSASVSPSLSLSLCLSLCPSLSLSSLSISLHQSRVSHQRNEDTIQEVESKLRTEQTRRQHLQTRLLAEESTHRKELDELEKKCQEFQRRAERAEVEISKLRIVGR
jgi:septal ring factor EnvC (AmiA/AmiB activator)